MSLPQPPRSHPITITDIDIPFARLVMIMVKFALASIPAMLIVSVIYWLVAMLFTGLFMGFGRMH